MTPTLPDGFAGKLGPGVASGRIADDPAHAMPMLEAGKELCRATTVRG
jgi:hypothetical protein